MSAYNYVANNPLVNIDPDGMAISRSERMGLGMYGTAPAPENTKKRTVQIIAEDGETVDYKKGMKYTGRNKLITAAIKMLDVGINGGFSVTNNSTQNVLIFGNNLQINNDGSSPQTGAFVQFLLESGQRLEPTFSINETEDGTMQWRFDGNIVDANTGAMIEENIGIYDVDGASLNTFQVVERTGEIVAIGGLSEPYLPDFPGEIKFQSGYSSAIDDKILGHPTPQFTNRSNIDINTTARGNIEFRASGIPFISKPRILFGRLGGVRP